MLHSLKAISCYCVAMMLLFYVVGNQAAESTTFPCVISAKDILAHYDKELKWIDTRWKEEGLGGRQLDAAELSAGLYITELIGYRH